ncbi:NAD(P)-binding protein [Polychaeton citri CBS 116435]|uniref:NAD(P)-binding protein n=1 Tax=Polychaeton citri CBS 116435 TaxID=1314669 RepID=A0A9P4QE48_9PEZI|nr:NAD(P)-binding protein [Polychaeton citri CBS 116435]
MLILIPGATGNLGVRLVRSATRRGHRVRALGRSPLKMPLDLRDQLESFVEITHFGDTAAFEKGCAGVDAIVVAWNENPLLVLDAQLALLRAAESAGIKRFHAVSWNTDWEKMPLGTIESYDAMISFARQALLTSPIKPLYVFCGVLAMTLFGVPGAGSLEGDASLWTRKEGGNRMINVVGAGTTQTPFSTEDDVADFSIALITSENAEKGGYYRFCSDDFSIQSLKAVYEKVRGGDCLINHVTDVQSCKMMIEQARYDARKTGELRHRYKDIVGMVYAVFLDEGTYNFQPVDADRFPDVPRTKLEEYIQNNDWV